MRFSLRVIYVQKTANVFFCKRKDTLQALIVTKIYIVTQIIGQIFVRFNFIKYLPIFEIVSLSQSGRNL